MALKSAFDNFCRTKPTAGITFANFLKKETNQRGYADISHLPIPTWTSQHAAFVKKIPVGSYFDAITGTASEKDQNLIQNCFKISGNPFKYSYDELKQQLLTLQNQLEKCKDYSTVSSEKKPDATPPPPKTIKGGLKIEEVPESCDYLPHPSQSADFYLNELQKENTLNGILKTSENIRAPSIMEPFDIHETKESEPLGFLVFTVVGLQPKLGVEMFDEKTRLSLANAIESTGLKVSDFIAHGGSKKQIQQNIRNFVSDTYPSSNGSSDINMHHFNQYKSGLMSRFVCFGFSDMSTLQRFTTVSEFMAHGKEVFGLMNDDLPTSVRRDMVVAKGASKLLSSVEKACKTMTMHTVAPDFNRKVMTMEENVLASAKKAADAKKDLTEISSKTDSDDHSVKKCAYTSGMANLEQKANELSNLFTLGGENTALTSTVYEKQNKDLFSIKTHLPKNKQIAKSLNDIMQMYFTNGRLFATALTAKYHENAAWQIPLLETYAKQIGVFAKDKKLWKLVKDIKNQSYPWANSTPQTFFSPITPHDEQIKKFKENFHFLRVLTENNAGKLEAELMEDIEGNLDINPIQLKEFRAFCLWVSKEFDSVNTITSTNWNENVAYLDEDYHHNLHGTDSFGAILYGGYFMNDKGKSVFAPKSAYSGMSIESVKDDHDLFAENLQTIMTDMTNEYRNGFFKIGQSGFVSQEDARMWSAAHSYLKKHISALPEEKKLDMLVLLEGDDHILKGISEISEGHANAVSEGGCGMICIHGSQNFFPDPYSIAAAKTYMDMGKDAQFAVHPDAMKPATISFSKGESPKHVNNVEKLLFLIDDNHVHHQLSANTNILGLKDALSIEKPKLVKGGASLSAKQKINLSVDKFADVAKEVVGAPLKLTENVLSIFGFLPPRAHRVAREFRPKLIHETRNLDSGIFQNAAENLLRITKSLTDITDLEVTKTLGEYLTAAKYQNNHSSNMVRGHSSRTWGKLNERGEVTTKTWQASETSTGSTHMKRGTPLTKTTENTIDGTVESMENLLIRSSRTGVTMVDNDVSQAVKLVGDTAETAVDMVKDVVDEGVSIVKHTLRDPMSVPASVPTHIAHLVKEELDDVSGYTTKEARRVNHVITGKASLPRTVPMLSVSADAKVHPHIATLLNNVSDSQNDVVKTTLFDQLVNIRNTKGGGKKVVRLTPTNNAMKCFMSLDNGKVAQRAFGLSEKENENPQEMMVRLLTSQGSTKHICNFVDAHTILEAEKDFDVTNTLGGCPVWLNNDQKYSSADPNASKAHPLPLFEPNSVHLLARTGFVNTVETESGNANKKIIHTVLPEYAFGFCHNTRRGHRRR